jgi:hypothetical protein
MAKKQSSDDWSESFSLRLDMRVSSEFYKNIDEWRRKQPDLPSRTAAIRRLVELGLKVKEKRNQ